MLSTFLRKNLHREPRLVQDTKVTANQGRKKNVQVISHLQDDPLQWHMYNKPAQESWLLEVRGEFLTFQKSRSLDQLLQKHWGKKSTELVPIINLGQIHDLHKMTISSSSKLDLKTPEFLLIPQQAGCGEGRRCPGMAQTMRSYPKGQQIF